MNRMDENDWATETLKEVPFWREDMTPDEYDTERKYYAKNYHLIRDGKMKYVPLWKQKQEKN